MSRRCSRIRITAAAIRHVVVREGERILGVVRVNTALRHAFAQADIATRDIGSPNFKVVHANDIVFDVIHEMWNRGTG